MLEYPDNPDLKKSVPIEDIGILLIDHRQITLSHSLISALMENNTAVISCDKTRKPQGLMLPMYSHHAYVEKLYSQLEASQPLKKNLWQQTIAAKIRNQAIMLHNLDIDVENMGYWMKSVRSGDPDNYEARAAAYYWDKIFEHLTINTGRTRFGDPPNNLLNYGYAVLRAIIARSLVGSGMLPAIGIHHRNKYNPFCLADDIMEPYRPFVDKIVLQICREESEIDELTPALKRKLLQIPVVDVSIDHNKSPLMIAAQRTTSSLMRCFAGEIKKIVYPEMELNEQTKS
ncbi:MAG: type II CRISPR-associated endonuclease Cas1 [Bacteroidota bacterium]|nr:type II CRISPR-associated endonuclease Cas1 [Bacteroidota bacterium]